MYQLIINTKAYSQAIGKSFDDLVKACKKLQPQAKKNNVEIILAPLLSEIASLPASFTWYSQHCDPVKPGGHTGSISPENLYNQGCKGTLLNHSEKRLPKKRIHETLDVARNAGLKVCICARTPNEAKKLSEFKPDCIALEPKELIGGDISIATAKPGHILEAENLIAPIPLLVGAGVKTKQDVKKSVELGAKGVLVASGVVKAENKEEAIKELLEGFSTNS